jgi:hypothetical protein
MTAGMHRTMMTRAELRQFFDEQFCGCGSPDQAAAAFLRLLELHPLYNHGAEFERWIADDGIACLLLYHLDTLGLTEHGSSISEAWLTEKGTAFREALRVESGDNFEMLFQEHCSHGLDLDDPCRECQELQDQAFTKRGTPGRDSV